MGKSLYNFASNSNNSCCCCCCGSKSLKNLSENSLAGSSSLPRNTLAGSSLSRMQKFRRNISSRKLFQV